MNRRLVTAAVAAGVLAAAAMSSGQLALIVLPFVPVPLALAWRGQTTGSRSAGAVVALIAAAGASAALAAGAGLSVGDGIFLGVLTTAWAGLLGAVALVRSSTVGSVVYGRPALAVSAVSTLPAVAVAGALVSAGRTSGVDWFVGQLERDFGARQQRCGDLESGTAEWVLQSCGSLEPMSELIGWIGDHALQFVVATLVVATVSIGVSAAIVYLWLAARRAPEGPRLARVVDFELHWSSNYVVAVGVLACGLGMVLDGNSARFATGAGAGLLVVAGAGFVAQGIAVVAWMFRRSGRSSTLKVVFWVVAFVAYVISVPLLAAIGVLEQLMRIRRRQPAADRDAPRS